MLQQALQKIQKEIGEKPKDVYVNHVGAFLIKHIKEHPEYSAFIIADDKTITGSLAAMKDAARKQQSNGVGVLTDEEGFKIVLSYYGIPVSEAVKAAAEPELSISSLDDLL